VWHVITKNEKLAIGKKDNPLERERFQSTKQQTLLSPKLTEYILDSKLIIILQPRIDYLGFGAFF